LAEQGITTAWQFAQMNDAWIKKNFTIVGLRTAQELRGNPCIEMEMHPADKKNILCSRSFGKPISELADLKAAVSEFVQEVAEKLRAQKSVCRTIGVLLLTNPHRKEQKQYYNSTILALPFAANDNLTLQEIAFLALEKIYKTGYLFKKAGVFVNDLFPEENLQYTLWDDTRKIFKRRKLFSSVDMINARIGEITLAIQKTDEAKHHMRQTKKSPEYTTDIRQVPKIDMD
jgi:DNA polymerase V